MGKFLLTADGGIFLYLCRYAYENQNTAKCDPRKGRQQGGSLKNSGDCGLFSEKWWR